MSETFSQSEAMEFLEELRLKLGWSQRRMSREMGYKGVPYNQWLNGKSNMPKAVMFFLRLMKEMSSDGSDV